MAAAGPSVTVHSLPSNVVIKAEAEPEDGLPFRAEDVIVKREPVVPLLTPVSGLQPLSWSQDHRLAVCTTCSLSLMELVCDVHSNKQDLTLHRTSIPVPSDVHRMQVNATKCSPVEFTDCRTDRMTDAEAEAAVDISSGLITQPDNNTDY